MATTALVAGTATPVQAATTVAVHETDINQLPLPYEGWHEESGNPRSFGINDDGLVLLNHAQIINGYDSNLPPLNTRNVSLTRSFVNAVSVDTVEGQAYLQIPMYFTGPGTALPQFTTLYSANPVDGPIDYDSTLFHNSQDVGSFPALSMHTLADFMTQIDNYKVRGFGVATGGAPELSATVASITWDGTTYDFVPAVEGADQVNGSDIAPAGLVGYLGWHQEDDAASPGAARVLNRQGLQLTGPSQVINGYVNAAPDVDPPTFPDSVQPTNLVSEIANANITMTQGNATLQVPMWVKPVGSDSYLYTTLYPAVPAGEGTTTFSLSDEWKSSRAIGTLAADAPYPLWQVLDALGSDYLVIGIGVQEDPGETSIVKSLSWLDTTYTFDNPTPVNELITNDEVSSSGTPYAGWHQGYAEGSATPVDRQQVGPTGLVLDPLPSQVVRGEANNTNEFDGHQYELADVLADGAEVTVGAGQVTFQIALFFKDNNGAPKFTTLRSEVFGVGTHQLDPWADWTTSAQIRSANLVPFAPSSQHTIAEYVDAFRDYKVIGFGVQTTDAPATVTNLAWAGTKYDFRDTVPVAGTVSAKTTAGKAVNISLKASDPEGVATSITITKAPAHGKVTVNQSTEVATYTPASGFAGSDSFSYTVKDAGGYAATGKVTVSVAKATSSVSASIKNKPITTKKKAKIAVTVKATGAVLTNGKVKATSGGNQVGSGKVNSNGKVTLTLKKLKKGSKKVKISFAGTASAASSAKTITIKVKVP